MPLKPTPKSHRLRIGRHSEPGRIYLITVCCYQRRAIFSAFATGRRVIEAMQMVQEGAETLAFVVMPDHIHWLMQLQEGGELSACVQKMKSCASRLIHQHTQYQARVWAPSFHDHALRQCEDLKAISRYIILNPVRAGLVSQVGDYPLWDAIWL